MGFEPTTVRLRIESSTTELHRHFQIYIIANSIGFKMSDTYIMKAMTDSPKNKPGSQSKKKRATLSSEKYARLKAEAKAPYKGLRKFFYISFGASGFVGAFIFLTQIAAGREVSSALPNFALQIGVIALTIWLFRLEDKGEKKK